MFLYALRYSGSSSAELNIVGADAIVLPESPQSSDNHFAVRVCGAVADSVATTVFVGLQACDVLERCTTVCAGAVALDSSPPRVDQAVATMELPEPLSALQSLTPASCQCRWRDVVDDGSGLSHFTVCVTSQRLGGCDVSDVVTVPAGSASSWSAAFPGLQLPMPPPAAVYCLTTAVDRAGNAVAISSPRVAVVDDIVAVMTVTLAATIPASATTPLPPTPTVWRHPIGVGT